MQDPWVPRDIVREILKSRNLGRGEDVKRILQGTESRSYRWAATEGGMLCRPPYQATRRFLKPLLAVAHILKKRKEHEEMDMETLFTEKGFGELLDRATLGVPLPLFKAGREVGFSSIEGGVYYLRALVGENTDTVGWRSDFTVKKIILWIASLLRNNEENRYLIDVLSDDTLWDWRPRDGSSLEPSLLTFSAASKTFRALAWIAVRANLTYRTTIIQPDEVATYDGLQKLVEFLEARGGR